MQSEVSDADGVKALELAVHGELECSLGWAEVDYAFVGG